MSSFAEAVPDDVVNPRFMRLIPKVVCIQYAGNMGLAAVGFGYSTTSERCGVQFFYGYLPKQLSGVEVKTIAVKGFVETNKRYPFSGVTTSNYAGINFLYARTHNTFTSLPDYFPKDYYPPNTIHFAPFLGGKINFDINDSKCFSNAGFFFELGTLETYLISFRNNSNTLKFHEIWNLSFGLSLSLNRQSAIRSIRERI